MPVCKWRVNLELISNVNKNDKIHKHSQASHKKSQPMEASAGVKIDRLASVPVLLFVVCFFLGKSRAKDITKAGTAV
jgi:hypothetical protein